MKNSRIGFQSSHIKKGGKWQCYYQSKRQCWVKLHKDKKNFQDRTWCQSQNASTTWYESKRQSRVMLHKDKNFFPNMTGCESQNASIEYFSTQDRVPVPECIYCIRKEEARMFFNTGQDASPWRNPLKKEIGRENIFQHMTGWQSRMHPLQKERGNDNVITSSGGLVIQSQYW